MLLVKLLPVPRGPDLFSHPLAPSGGSNSYASCLFGVFSCFSRVLLRDGETQLSSSQHSALTTNCRYRPAGVADPGRVPKEARIRPDALSFPSSFPSNPLVERLLPLCPFFILTTSATTPCQHTLPTPIRSHHVCYLSPALQRLTATLLTCLTSKFATIWL